MKKPFKGGILMLLVVLILINLTLNGCSNQEGQSNTSEDVVAGDTLYVPEGYQNKLASLQLKEVVAMPYFRSPFISVAQDSNGTQFAVIFRESGEIDRQQLPVTYIEIINLIKSKVGYKVYLPDGNFKNLHLFEINENLVWSYYDGKNKLYVDKEGREIEPFIKKN
ncbi:hypothetical protein [Paenibacillus roseipurpureus]|uniref:Uncharacterized protein n=1 Tax=Paenibacillus roseopurpureus TaxID=2918901 RepID=A0AA96LQ94_9BACL|nr:hypothetical protein [Paenibacillus sp. MBLB1832]WNR43843.1 hypothetical protein MJB10_22520 [Paenibacillus sp. MBLB1832]